MCIATKNGNSNITNTTITKGKEHHRNRSTSSALQRMAPLILSGYLFNTLCYFLLYTILPSNLTPVPKYCPLDNPHCKRHGLLAFQLVSLLNLSYLGLLGVYTFFISKRALNELPQTPQGRYFGNVLTEGRVLLPEADWICAVIVIFQGWDFVVSMFFEEHCTRIMMCHHFLAFICGFFCLVYEVRERERERAVRVCVLYCLERDSLLPFWAWWFVRRIYFPDLGSTSIIFSLLDVSYRWTLSMQVNTKHAPFIGMLCHAKTYILISLTHTRIYLKKSLHWRSKRIQQHLPLHFPILSILSTRIPRITLLILRTTHPPPTFRHWSIFTNHVRH